MSSKPGPIQFQPAPRPQPRVSPEQSRELAEATRDLGFGRTTSSNDADPSPDPPRPAAAMKAAEPPSQRLASKAAKRTAPAAEVVPERMATLKVAMPDKIWDALRHEALNRRVTVKYLVLEALAAKGYEVDLSTVAEDGRRLR